MHDLVARCAMLDIAAQYERIAQRAEQQTKLGKRPPAPSVQSTTKTERRPRSDSG
jgi:hypothetical protein